MTLCSKVQGILIHLCVWIIFLADLVSCEVCTNGKTCEYGCCSDDNGSPTCCSEPFWTWGVIVGICAGAIFGIVLLVFAVLACIYCKKKPTHSNRLRHTVSMRSNRIYPFPDLPPYEETDTSYPYEPPPKYEDISTYNRRNLVPIPRSSANLPTISHTISVSPR